MAITAFVIGVVERPLTSSSAGAAASSRQGGECICLARARASSQTCLGPTKCSGSGLCELADVITLTDGPVERCDGLGGLHHEYHCAHQEVT